MLDEIAKAIPIEVSPSQTKDFGMKVLDRFRNPHIEHLWHSISMNYTSKLKLRVLPLLHTWYQRFGTTPELTATGFAAYLLFMKGVKQEGGKVYATLNGNDYVLNDDFAPIIYEIWQSNPQADVAQKVLSSTELWGEDLTKLDGFAKLVSEKLKAITTSGVASVINN
jgi:tagaturonate reductase